MKNKTTFVKVDRKERNFTMVDNAYIQRSDLSWKAKGIMTYILHLPTDWNINLIEVMRHATDGEASFRSGWKELEEKGYVKRYPIKDEQTKRIKYWETVVHEVSKKPHGEKPDVENPHVEKPDVENHNLLSTKVLSTNKQSTNNSPAEAERIPYQEIIEYLNEQADRNFNHKASGNKDLIRARWNEGYDLHDFKQAIDNKVAHADDPNHFFTEEYLRPSTLFRKSNFDEYVNAVVKSRRQKVEVTTDFDNLSGLLGDENE